MNDNRYKTKFCFIIQSHCLQDRPAKFDDFVDNSV